ncbi:hypothetical protein [Salinimicrobium terrae]|uniref:hypothetical protein n=1 Tax=Salinimicrobium terrae TaxID=470866 RepID=UPI0004245D3E|nr:hypothetical protein [Salinimicrobium terrae]
MSFLDNDILLYIILILVFVGFFLWNRKQTKNNRDIRKNKSFRNRYNERKEKGK